MVFVYILFVFHYSLSFIADSLSFFAEYYSKFIISFLSNICVSSFSFYFIVGKVNATIKAINITTVETIEGIGLSNSAIRGAKMHRNLAMKLQMPIAVALLISGNTLGSE